MLQFKKSALPLSDVSSDVFSVANSQIIVVNGKTCLIPNRVPVKGRYTIIDAVNFVFDVDSLNTNEMYDLNVNFKDLFGLDKDLLVEQYDYLMDCALNSLISELDSIFGNGNSFGALIPMLAGIHHYKKGFFLKNEVGEVLATIGIGGQRNTVFVGVTGTGCKHGADGWESRLHHYLDNVAVNGRISRIDIAHDDIQGKYSSFDLANQAESNDKFMLSKSRNRPACNIAGEYKHNDPYNKGLTLYVGNRKNGKIIRCYEKGKQLGDVNSRWFRSELELHNSKYFIPLDVLLYADEYFAGAYPYCAELLELAIKNEKNKNDISQKKIKTIKNERDISLAKSIAVFKNQFGKYLRVYGDIYVKKNAKGKSEINYKKIYEMLITDKTNPKDYYPKRLKILKEFNQDIIKNLALPSRQRKPKDDGFFKVKIHESNSNYAWC